MPKDESNPYFTYDPSKCIVCSRCVRACEEVQGTFALTIEGRGFEAAFRRACTRLPRFGMRVLRRLRAGLPDRDADREIGDRDRPARAFGCHHLRLLRRRLLVQGGNARRGAGAHGAVQGRQGQSRPFLRQGPFRLWLCDPQGPHPQSDDPREDHRSLARSVWEEAFHTAAKKFRRIQYQYGKDLDRRHHLVALHQ
jgi:formate dehydrogenase major subunit